VVRTCLRGRDSGVWLGGAAGVWRVDAGPAVRSARPVAPGGLTIRLRPAARAPERLAGASPPHEVHQRARALVVWRSIGDGPCAVDGEQQVAARTVGVHLAH
jgi:hypothetical protein